MKRPLLLSLCAGLLAIAAPCQIGAGEVGLSMNKPSGNAGSLCSRTFSCSFVDTNFAGGETVDVAVRGVFGQPFIVFVGAARPPQCLTIQGFHNSLMVVPLIIPVAGVMDEWDTVRACPGGLETFSFTVPPNLPIGAEVAFQAIAWSFLFPKGEVPTFTQAIRGTTI